MIFRKWEYQIEEIKVDDLPWVTKGATLFSDSGTHYEKAHLVRNQGKGSFNDYIQGYFLAANTLVDKLLADGQSAINDKVAMPVFFLYRQFIELYLKNLYFFFDNSDTARKIENIRNASHNIMKMWELVLPLVMDDPDSAAATEGYLRQYHDFDNKSFTFRYPVDKEFLPFLKEDFFINLRILRDRMDELASYFEGVESALEYKEEIDIEYCAMIGSAFWP